MQCAACGHDNREQAKFCEECAAPMTGLCPTCGVELRPAAKFCDQCGTRLVDSSQSIVERGGAARRSTLDSRLPSSPHSYTPRHLAEKILNSRAALEGERKHVTVLFVDCVGFTPLAEPVDP